MLADNFFLPYNRTNKLQKSIKFQGPKVCILHKNFHKTV